MALPFLAAGGAIPALAVPSGSLIAVFFALVMLDAVWAFRSLDGINVELPDLIRLSKDRTGEIELRIKNEKQKAKSLRVGLALPPEICSLDEELRVALPVESPLSRLCWPCTPLKRGNYFLDKCYLETGSPFGFWAIRRATPTHTEIRVYPDMSRERRNLSGLFLNRGGVGLHSQRQVGRGREFEKLRQYMPGDSYDEIHWKATAKRRHPVTKIFQIERTQEVYVIIDASRLSARRSDSPLSGDHESQTTLERFITAALVIGLAAEKQGDLFGVLTFSDGVQRFLRAKNGKAHYNACRDALYTLEPQIVTPDFQDLCAFIRLRLRRRALLAFLTDLSDPVVAESFVRSVDLISRHHLVVVNMLKSPNVTPLFSDSDVTSTQDLYEKLAGHILWHDLRELEKILHRRGVRFSLLDHEKLSIQLVSQYMSVKQRQLL
ncbi:MAG: DUF58 domain-containing protein [Nitrospiraceae bacterium]